MMDINMDLLKRFINFLIKKLLVEQLAAELHKPFIRKFEKRKVHSPFIDNIWCADLADLQMISRFNKRFRFLLCVTEIYSKHAQVIPLNDKKEMAITNAF